MADAGSSVSSGLAVLLGFTETREGKNIPFSLLHCHSLFFPSVLVLYTQVKWVGNAVSQWLLLFMAVAFQQLTLHQLNYTSQPQFSISFGFIWQKDYISSQNLLKIIMFCIKNLFALWLRNFPSLRKCFAFKHH